MARLTSAQRRRLPKSAFAVPSKDGYPIHDPAHARNALSRVSQFGSPGEKAQVRGAVKRKFPSIGGASAGSKKKRRGGGAAARQRGEQMARIIREAR